MATPSSESPQDQAPLPFFDPDVIGEDAALAAGLLQVVHGLTEGGRRKGFVATLDRRAAAGEDSPSLGRASRTAQANRGSLTGGAWDAFMTAAGRPEYVGLNGADPLVNGTLEHGLWVRFRQTYIGPENADTRRRYVSRLRKIAGPAIDATDDPTAN